jgi:hypothetical protein
VRHEVCNDRSLRGCKGDFIVSRAADEKTLIDVLSKSLTVCSVVPSFDASRFSGVFVRLYFSVSPLDLLRSALLSFIYYAFIHMSRCNEYAAGRFRVGRKA